MNFRLLSLFTLCLLFTSCSQVYYGAMDKLGYEKRHILVSRVKKAKSTQEEAKEEFSSALEEFMAASNYQGGSLERTYNRIERAYESSRKQADEVRNRNDAVENTGNALFTEWEQEINTFSDVSLATSSRQQYDAAKVRFRELSAAMSAAESKLDPVLTKFRDQTLYLKHNLNARAINALESQVARVRIDVAQLIAEMEHSISEADRFISTME